MPMLRHIGDQFNAREICGYMTVNGANKNHASHGQNFFITKTGRFSPSNFCAPTTQIRRLQRGTILRRKHQTIGNGVVLPGSRGAVVFAAAEDATQKEHNDADS
jgi:hypothetical protein